MKITTPKGRLNSIFRRPFSTLQTKNPHYPLPQISPKPVNSAYFNNFLETNHAPYPPAPPVPAPYRRTRPVVFSAGQGSRRPKNFRRALLGGGVWLGKLLGMAEAG